MTSPEGPWLAGCTPTALSPRSCQAKKRPGGRGGVGMRSGGVLPYGGGCWAVQAEVSPDSKPSEKMIPPNRRP